MMEMVGDSRKNVSWKSSRKDDKKSELRLNMTGKISERGKKLGNEKMQIGTDSKELLGIVNELSGKQCDTRWAGTTELRDYTPRTRYHSILS